MIPIERPHSSIEKSDNSESENESALLSVLSAY